MVISRSKQFFNIIVKNMNPIKKTEEIPNVPNNLPHEDKDNININYDIKIKIPKKGLKTFAKVAIIILVIVIAAPRIISNISSTTKMIQDEAGKLPKVFPSLTTVGSTIGSFVYTETKNISSFLSENLALMAELLYSRKLDRDDVVVTTTPIEKTAKPVRLIIDKIGVDTDVLNPESTNIETLEESIKTGVARYPKSGLLGENDNIYIFGHSTSIQVVRNQAYKALNDLNKLQPGDEIKVQSAEREYLYKVKTVRMEKDSQAVVKFNTGKRTLTISTCNTLGNKEDRHIVEADFVISYPLATTDVTEEDAEVNETTPATSTTNTNIVAGEETETIIPMNESVVVPVVPSDPLGRIDLSAEITEIGILDPVTNDFVATTTLSNKDKIAFKFIISNLGTKEVSGWSFNVVLPTDPSYLYHSTSQQRLGPGERIEYALGFDRAKIGDNNEIIVNVDPTRSIGEITEDNNIVKQTITVTQ